MFDFDLQQECGSARAGALRLPRGDVDTPAFMPVGTHGTVRALSSRDLREIGAQIVLGNTYHLHVRPGEEVVTALVTVSLTGVTHTFVALGIIPGLPSSMTFPAFSTSALRATEVITPP